MRKEVVQIREELHDKYKEKIIRTVKLVSDKYEGKLTAKQEQLLLHFMDLRIRFPKKRWAVSDLLKKTN